MTVVENKSVRNKYAKRLNNTTVQSILTVAAMCGEVSGRISESMPNISYQSVKKHLDQMSVPNIWKSDYQDVCLTNLQILSRHGDKSKCMYSLTNSAIDSGILDDVGMYEYWRLYSKPITKNYSDYRERNRKQSCTVMGLHNAGVLSFPNERKVPEIDVLEYEFGNTQNSFYYPLKEIRRDLGAGMDNTAYGKSLGLLITPRENVVLYGMNLKKETLYNQKSEDRCCEAYMRFVRKHSDKGYSRQITKAIWTGAGYAPVQARIRELDKMNLGSPETPFFYDQYYDEAYYIPYSEFKNVLSNIGKYPKGYVTLLDGEAAKWADWISEGKNFWFNGITCNLSKLFQFRYHAFHVPEVSYTVLCLESQVEFYKNIFTDKQSGKQTVKIRTYAKE